ncbi:hypothetical protein, partial [Bacillus mycoides]|uniref:hypothetical protein n=1 Tax=Bacillus mycoides TaxID=1405 RepID=UPI001C92EBFB
QNQKPPQTTIKHAHFNTHKLLPATQPITQKLIKTILTPKSTPTPQHQPFYKQTLLQLTHQQAHFSSFMQHILPDYFYPFLYFHQLLNQKLYNKSPPTHIKKQQSPLHNPLINQHIQPIVPDFISINV